jgi:DNA-directed RNA polymerase subunit RPC12/RpoP
VTGSLFSWYVLPAANNLEAPANSLEELSSSRAEGVAVLHYSCPKCQSPLESLESQAGRKVACPTCGQRMAVPWPAKKKTVVAELDEDDEPAPRRGYDNYPPARYREDDNRGRRYADDDDDDYQRPGRRLRRRERNCECPNCGAVGETYERKEIAQEGWIVLVVLLLTFFPLFFLGLLMKQNYLICRECGYKIRKLDGITFG